jgi:hypothetical protein
VVDASTKAVSSEPNSEDISAITKLKQLVADKKRLVAEAYARAAAAGAPGFAVSATEGSAMMAVEAATAYMHAATSIAAPVIADAEQVAEAPRLRRRTRSSSSIAADADGRTFAPSLNANAAELHPTDSAVEIPQSITTSSVAPSTTTHAVLATAAAAALPLPPLALALAPIPAPSPVRSENKTTLLLDAAAPAVDTAWLVPAPGSIAMQGAAANGLETRCPVGQLVAKLTLAAETGEEHGVAAKRAVTQVLSEQTGPADPEFASFLAGAGWMGTDFSAAKGSQFLLKRAEAHINYQLDQVVPESQMSRGYREREAYYTQGAAADAKGGLTDNMWSILADWMIEVQINYELSQETLFLSIDILSRYIRVKQVARTDLQLIGAASLLIASKYEEIYPPEVNSFVYICANTYTRDALLLAERSVLLALDYKLSSPLAWHFLNWVGGRCRMQKEQLSLAQYFLESTLQEREFRGYPRSLVAAAALNLAGRVSRCDEGTLEQAAMESEYTMDEIAVCAKKLNALHLQHNPDAEMSHNNNCRRKYSDMKHDFVGAMRVAFMYYE